MYPTINRQVFREKALHLKDHHDPTVQRFAEMAELILQELIDLSYPKENSNDPHPKDPTACQNP